MARKINLTLFYFGLLKHERINKRPCLKIILNRFSGQMAEEPLTVHKMFLLLLAATHYTILFQ